MGAFPGVHVTKTRPAVVLSTELYHRHRPDVVVGLITTQAPSPIGPIDCELYEWKQAGFMRRPILGCFQSPYLNTKSG